MFRFVRLNVSPNSLLNRSAFGRLRVARRFTTPLTPNQGYEALKVAQQALLNNEKNWWARQKLRVRLLLMGKVRPLRVDDVVALVSWVFVSQTVFILVGTTTFVSILLVLTNTLSFQEYLGSRVCEMLTKLTGYTISFETAIVPRWREGTIRLGNVHILCDDKSWTELSRKAAEDKGEPFDPKSVNLNFTYWDVTVDYIDITLSLWRWFDGRGLVESAKFSGVRGACDRRHLFWPEDWKPTRHSPQFGDFDLEKLIINDALVKVMNPNFRPYSVSIFQAKFNNFRRQWLLFDIFCADSIVGTIDECLFSVHKPQIKDLLFQKELEASWSKLSNLKLYGLPIAHLNTGITGPFGWINSGTVDIDLHFLVPHTAHDEDLFDKILDEVDGLKEIAFDKIERVIHKPLSEKSKMLNLKDMRHYGLQYKSNKKEKEVDTTKKDTQELPLNTESDVVMLWKVNLKDLKAQVPLVHESLGYMSSALIRPVVGYMNSNKTSINLSLSARMDKDNFNGSWDIYSSGLSDILSEEVGRAIMALVNNEAEQSKRLKQIGLWSVSELSQAILKVVEHTRGDRGWSQFEPRYDDPFLSSFFE